MGGALRRLFSRRVSKSTLLWSIVTTPFATLFVGFVFFDLTTTVRAADEAERSAATARTEFAADLCYSRFMNASTAEETLSDFWDLSPFVRDEVLEQRGWVTFGTRERPMDKAADICARRLADLVGTDSQRNSSAESAAMSATL